MQEMIIITKKDTDQYNFRLFLEQNNIEIFNDYKNLKTFYYVKVDNNEKLNLIKNDKRVFTVEYDDNMNIQLFNDIKEQKLDFNSNMLNDNWGLERIIQNKPVDFNQNNHNYKYFRTGKNVDIYVVDTGVRTDHDDLDGRAEHLYTPKGTEAWEEDSHGHGTSVSSNAAGKRYGVAKEAKIYNCRALFTDQSDYDPPFSRWTEVFDKIIEHHTNKIENGINRPSIVNLSLGGGSKNRWNSFTDELINNGIVVVTAAGNSDIYNDNNNPRVYPAGSPGVITVGATDIYDNFASFTNYGPFVDINAPGTNVLLADNSSKTATTIIQGTSFSCPFTAGVCALILDGSDIGNNSEYVNKVRNILLENSIDNSVKENKRNTKRNMLYALIDNEPIKTNIVISDVSNNIQEQDDYKQNMNIKVQQHKKKKGFIAKLINAIKYIF